MDWKHLFTSFEGRIARKHFWLGVVLLIVANIILAIILAPVLGVNMFATMGTGTAEDQVAAMMMRQGWMTLLFLIIFIWPGAAISIKRRHDRGSAGNEIWAIYALQAVMAVLQITGLAMGMLGMILGFVLFVFGIYLLVVMGFLKGDAGANAYGPDPLDRA